jgi:glucokinase
MFLGLEIGGTKLQLGVGAGDGLPLAELLRFDVDRSQGAQAILAQIEEAGRLLAARHTIAAVGCGFGGPVDVAAGTVIKSHHVERWEEFPLAFWLGERFHAPVALANDADTAALAEARFGAGRGASPVLYVTVGTGIGGGLVLDGKIYRGSGAGAVEIGHLRPGRQYERHNLESLAAGWGIAARAARACQVRSPYTEALLAASAGERERIDARTVAKCAAAGDSLARSILSDAVAALGWGLAQAITLLAPAVVVVGGGVSLAGEELFFAQLRRDVERYVFPPLAGMYRLVPAELGEEVVVHGALALARDAGVAAR